MRARACLGSFKFVRYMLTTVSDTATKDLVDSEIEFMNLELGYWHLSFYEGK